MFYIQEKKFILLIGSFAVVFILIGSLVIFPQYNQIKETNKQISQLREQLETKYERAKQYHKSQTNLGMAKKLTESVKEHFLKKGKEIKLITILENQAEKLGLKQELNLSSTYTKLNNQLSSLGMEITLVGDPQKAMAYLNFLQKETFYLAINQVTVTKSAPSSLITEKSKAVSTPASLVTLNLKTAIYVQD